MANLTAFACATAASLLLAHWIPALLSAMAFACWLTARAPNQPRARRSPPRVSTWGWPVASSLNGIERAEGAFPTSVRSVGQGGSQKGSQLVITDVDRLGQRQPERALSVVEVRMTGYQAPV